MEPRQHEGIPNIDIGPSAPGYSEQLSQGEREPGHESEKLPGPEIGQVQAEAAQIAMPSLPAPVAVASNQGAQGQADDASLVAADDDLIEKEWVDRAKSIIASTKDNPYKREREINKLQIEYIRKRYGRTIGESSD